MIYPICEKSFVRSSFPRQRTTGCCNGLFDRSLQLLSTRCLRRVFIACTKRFSSNSTNNLTWTLASCFCQRAGTRRILHAAPPFRNKMRMPVMLYFRYWSLLPWDTAYKTASHYFCCITSNVYLVPSGYTPGNQTCVFSSRREELQGCTRAREKTVNEIVRSRPLFHDTTRLPRARRNTKSDIVSHNRHTNKQIKQQQNQSSPQTPRYTTILMLSRCIKLDCVLRHGIEDSSRKRCLMVAPQIALCMTRN